MSTPLIAVLVLLGIYVLGVTWQMRRAVRAPEGAPRLREATRLLGLVTLGVPLAIALLVVS
jgi:hypothetical protein